MARVFTITEGVENMGTLKTGGQGSVYKAKRIGQIISAIKILPTPIHSETDEDKNFVAFRNEVEKLKKVNEDANANVVTIVSSGITDSGNFPFIEMEYIEGPDLEELLQPPHDIIFTIQETLKVGEHLSNALAHCHKADVKHGDIKSNNVKFNSRTGNYILLDFGLSVMSDEQRRASLRQAGAVEFMAPEQHEGLLLFETEVYSFGVILFELLCGTVPFPLKDHSESARNAVMLAQMETTPPSLLSLRKQNLPEWWTAEKKEHEMQVPEWLISMIYKCLEKKPADRFANGMVLHDYIVRNSILAAGNIEWGAGRIAKLEQENELLLREKEGLLQKLSGHQKAGSGEKVAAPRPSVFKNIALLILSAAVIGFIINMVIARQNIKAAAVRTVVPASNAYVPTEEESFQLKKARQFLADGRIEESREVYKALADLEIPEAMYEFGNLTLLNNDDKTNCAAAFEYLKKAAGKDYLPAKRAVGFLYAFAGDSTALKQKGYQGCSFNYDIPKGARLLMEAALQGDAQASKLLSDLNLRYGAK